MSNKALSNESVNPSNASDNNGPDAVDGETRYLLLPLHSDVVFPGMTIGLPVQDPELANLIEETLPGRREVVVSTLKADSEDPPVANNFYPVGILGRVVQLIRKGGMLVVIFEGGDRANLQDFYPTGRSYHVGIERLRSTSPPADDQYWQAAVRNLRDSAMQFFRRSQTSSQEVEGVIPGLPIGNTALLTDFIAGHLALSLEQKQSLLE